MMSSTRPQLSPLAFALLALPVAGCTVARDDVGGSLESSIQPRQSRMMALASDTSSSAGASLAAKQPLASLPGEAGAVTSIREKTYVNGLRQDVVLRGGALKGVQNSLTVLARTSSKSTLDEAVPLFKPTEAAVRSEMGAQFPHVTMQVVERESSNAYGPYGLALGRATGDVHCLYMWQWIAQNRLPSDAGVTGPLSVRVRLCQAGATFDAMADLVGRLVVGREAATASPGASDPAVVSATPVLAEAKPAKTKRHRVAHHRSRAVQVAAAPASEPDIMQYTPATTPAPPSYAAAAIAPKMSTDLPAAAYLGPKAASQTSASKSY